MSLKHLDQLIRKSLLPGKTINLVFEQAFQLLKVISCQGENSLISLKYHNQK